MTCLHFKFHKLEVVPHIVYSIQVRQNPRPFSGYLHEHNEVLKHLQHKLLAKGWDTSYTSSSTFDKVLRNGSPAFFFGNG